MTLEEIESALADLEAAPELVQAIRDAIREPRVEIRELTDQVRTLERRVAVRQARLDTIGETVVAALELRQELILARRMLRRQDRIALRQQFADLAATRALLEQITGGPNPPTPPI